MASINSLRSKHGALLDAELLAGVYVELTCARQSALQLELIKGAPLKIHALVRARPHPLPPQVNADDRNAHREFVRTLGSEATWPDVVRTPTI
jgi:DNA polymerase III subunit epsilon